MITPLPGQEQQMIMIKQEPQENDHLQKTPELGDQAKPADK